MDCPTVKEIIAVMEKKKYNICKDKNKKGHDLNVVGIRTSDMTANTFNDWITVFYMSKGIWNFFAFPATTDPGTYYRENPMNVDGTAILKPGQYKGSHKIGKHRGKYTALVQSKSVTVYRDNDKNKTLNTAGAKEKTGLFGINIHRANASTASTNVDKWSAGCQVFQDPDHFDFFITLCQRQQKSYGNSFSYTLLEEKDFSSAQKKSPASINTQRRTSPGFSRTHIC